MQCKHYAGFALALVLALMLTSVSALVKATHSIEKRSGVSISRGPDFGINEDPYVLPQNRTILARISPIINYKDEANNIEGRLCLLSFQLGRSALGYELDLLNVRLREYLKSIESLEDQIAYLDKNMPEVLEGRSSLHQMHASRIFQTYKLEAQFKIVTKLLRESIVATNNSRIVPLAERKPRTIMDRIRGRNLNTQTQLNVVQIRLDSAYQTKISWTQQLSSIQKARMKRTDSNAPTTEEDKLAYYDYEWQMEPSKVVAPYFEMRILLLKRLILTRMLQKEKYASN